MDKLRLVLALRAEVERLRSLIHHDPAAFEADQRVGAVLVDADGRVLMQHVAPPVEKQAHAASRRIAPWDRPLPEDYPLPNEHAIEVSRAELLRQLYGSF